MPSSACAPPRMRRLVLTLPHFPAPRHTVPPASKRTTSRRFAVLALAAIDSAAPERARPPADAGTAARAAEMRTAYGSPGSEKPPPACSPVYAPPVRSSAVNNRSPPPLDPSSVNPDTAKPVPSARRIPAPALPVTTESRTARRRPPPPKLMPSLAPDATVTPCSVRSELPASLLSTPEPLAPLIARPVTDSLVTSSSSSSPLAAAPVTDPPTTA